MSWGLFVTVVYTSLSAQRINTLLLSAGLCDPPKTEEILQMKPPLFI